MADPPPWDADITLDTLQSVVTHVFLPPKLPQEAEEPSEEQSTHALLCKITAESARQFQPFVPSERQQTWSSVLAMLRHLGESVDVPLQPGPLAQDFIDMGCGDFRVIHVRAQNAAILVLKQKRGTIFEIFEAAPPAAEVMRATGKLICSYPGPAIEVPSDIAEDRCFLAELAAFIVQMDVEILDSVAVTTKAGSTVPEVRDTPHPRYISQLLVGILRGVGHEVDVHRITKRIGDDVLWKSAFKPFRRSPLWLIIRVTMMLLVPDDYKAFMLFLEAKLLKLCLRDDLKNDFKSDLLFAMRAKMARRLYKLGVSAPESVQLEVMNAARATEEILQQRWTLVQRAQAVSPLWDPARLNLNGDTSLTLPNSRSYLLKALYPSSLNTSPSDFNPKQSPRLQGTQNIEHFANDGLSRAVAADGHVALADFETSIQDHLDDWVSQHLSETSACATLASCVEQYVTLASRLYSHDVADQSVMVLTVMELWNALDRVATTQYPILLEYSPEIPAAFLEPLLLRTARSIDRSIAIEHYLRRRHAGATSQISIYSDPAAEGSLAVRYFRQSTELQDLKAMIEKDAQQTREAKRTELRNQNALHRRLTTEASTLDHSYGEDNWGYLIHLRGCAKCSLDSRARSLTIRLHEWPLPSDELEASTVVFEISCPNAISVWRAVTYGIICDVGRGRGRLDSTDLPKIVLRDYSGLKKWLSGPLTRITLGSTTKAFVQSHYAPTPIPATESTVCVNNGLQYQLFDIRNKTWAAGPFVGSDVARFGTLLLPDQSPYRYLQYAVRETCHTSNKVIADQSDCPKELTLHEHFAFGSLRSGPRLQWMNIVRELASNSLTFKRQEVHVLIAQAAWQIGAASMDCSHREWHVDLQDHGFGRLLTRHLVSLLKRVKANWLEGATVRSIILIAIRLLSTATEPAVHRAVYRLLREARAVTLCWLRELTQKLQDSSDNLDVDEYQNLVCEMAATCRSTYDVCSDHLTCLLRTSGDVSAAVQCAIRLHDNQPPSLEKAPMHVQALLCRDRRLSYQLEQPLRDLIHGSRQGFDDALTEIWPSYRPGPTACRALPSPNSRWLTTTTATRDGAGGQFVHFNLLEGRLLINGVPLGRLPRDMVSHRTYARTLGPKVLDVIPADLPGMQFATRFLVHGYQIFFAQDEGGSDLRIQAKHPDGTRVFELIPHYKLHGDFPKLLLEEHAHWLDLSSGEVEFRPLDTQWESQNRNWRLCLSQKSRNTVLPARMVEATSSRCLIDLHSQTHRMISQRLKPLEAFQYLDITFDCHQVVAHLPRFRLSFIINGDSELESRDLQNMVVDEMQSSGTMFGLQSQLVLRANHPRASRLPRSRSVIIPHGRVKVHAAPNDDHILVTIENTERHVVFHEYKIDADLRYLATNANLTSRLYKIYLHAVTSHCLPDPLTRQTGTEEALHELSVAATSSFQFLQEEQAHLLSLIGSLTPEQSWYPKHLQNMQTVHWSNLSPLSQHYAFHAAAQSILDYAESLQTFPDPRNIDLQPFMAIRDKLLLERSARRMSVFYPADATSGLAPTISRGNGDRVYVGRDVPIADSMRRESDAFWTSNLVQTHWATKLHVSFPLLQRMEAWKEISGPSQALLLSYSSNWLHLEIPSVWMSIYDLCRKVNQDGSRFQLVFSLSAMAYGANGASTLQDLIPVFLAIATNTEFQQLSPPPWSFYNLSHGYEPTSQKVRDFVSSTVYSVFKSPANHLPREEYETTSEYNRRRAAYYADETTSRTARFVRSLIDQWPCTEPHPLPTEQSWFDIPLCMREVHEYFTSCTRNGILRDFARTVESILHSRPSFDVRSSGSSTYTFVPALNMRCGASIEASAYVRLAQLLSDRTPSHVISPNVLVRFSNIPRKEADRVQTTELKALLSQFRSASHNSLRRRYGRDMEASCRELDRQNPTLLPGRLPSSTDVDAYRDDFKRHMLQSLLHLTKALSSRPSSSPESVLSVAGLWPRITPRSMLGRLTLANRAALSTPWISTLTTFACTFIEYQRSQRLVGHEFTGRKEEFFKELDTLPVEPAEAAENPDWLLIQIDGDFCVRLIQTQVAQEMIAPSSRENIVLQLNMGEGKSSVIVPMVAAVLADGSKLTRVVVLKALSGQMFQLLVERLGRLVNRRIFYMPFSRDVRINGAQLKIIQDLYDQCVSRGGVLVVQPEHILSFRLMGIDLLLNSKTAEGSNIAPSVVRMQDWLTTVARDVLDESDEILNVRYQLVYTAGEQGPLQDQPNRWTTTQQVFSVVLNHARRLKELYPDELEYADSGGGHFPTIRILPVSHPGVPQIISDLIADEALAGGISNLNLSSLPPHIREAAHRFITQKEASEDDSGSLKEVCGGTWKGILLLRGLLGVGVLVHALRERRYRVDYGLDPHRTLLAVPYCAKDVPTLRSEFGHPDVAITLTCLSYYYAGLTHTQLQVCFELLFKQDNPELEYCQWVDGCDSLPDELRLLSSVNTKDKHQFEHDLLPALARNHAVVDFYLSQVVFPKAAKEFPFKLSTSGWDLAEKKEHVTTGFSGTNDNRYLLPTSITQIDPVKQLRTNALVLMYLLQPENNEYVCVKGPNGEPHTAKAFLERLVKQDPEIRVLLDVGAQMLELQNEELVRYWLSLRKDLSAAIFFTAQDELSVLTHDGREEPLVSSPYRQQLDKCLVYLDDQHTRGTDLKLPRTSRAAVTLGPKVTKDRLLQGCMRMRKLGHGQSVMFFAPAEVDRSIRAECFLEHERPVQVLDIIRWAMVQTCTDIKHHLAHWAQQGVEYQRREAARRNYSETGDVEALKDWITPESRTLEEMYGPTTFSSQTVPSLTEAAFKIAAMRKRLDVLGVKALEDPNMDEEQEREVSHEIERERQIERPPKAQASTHRLSKDVKMFIRTGIIPSGSTRFVSLFAPLQTSEPGPWSPSLMATTDFSTTIVGSTSATLSDYLRPVQWIISSTHQGGLVLVVMSPYEVDALLPRIRASTVVHLHVYAPRVIQSMSSFSDLRFFCIPPVPSRGWLSPSLTVQCQLNLWAGQLYLDSDSTYVELCRLLNIEPSGKHARGMLHQMGMLKELTGLRRKGVSYLRTHMGKILSEWPIREGDF